MDNQQSPSKLQEDSEAPPAAGASTSPNRTHYTALGFLLGILLGYPVSYYFQPAALRAKLSLGGYIQHISEIVGEEQLRSGILVGFVVAIVVGVAVGVVLDRVSAAKRQ